MQQQQNMMGMMNQQQAGQVQHPGMQMQQQQQGQHPHMVIKNDVKHS